MKTRCDRCCNKITLADMPGVGIKLPRNEHDEILVLCKSCRKKMVV